MSDKLAKQQACKLFIEQEIEEAIQQDDVNISAKAKEIAEWVNKLFEATISKESIRGKIYRAKSVQSEHSNVSNSNDTEIVNKRDEQGKFVDYAGPGRPIKFALIDDEMEKEIYKKLKNEKKELSEQKRQEIVNHLEDIKVKEAKAIEGVYDVVVIDPPWEMNKIERDVAPNQMLFDYPTMSIEEISNIIIPAANDCHLFLWTTHKHLPYAFDILKSWGFKYICNFVWHKNGGFQPFNLPQYNCEFVLYAHKGNPQFIDTKDFFTCFNAGRTGHSRKPDEFYDTVRRVTAGRRIDMFAREPRRGFDIWGKEVDNG